MKTTVMIFFQILVASCCCFGQSIDTTALHILQKSYDQLAAMKTISYRLTKVDTMLRANSPLLVRTETVEGILKKKAYWHLRFDDNTEWLVQNDTLYKKETTEAKPITFTTDWNNHVVLSKSIHHILGETRPVLEKSTATLQFVQGINEGKYYVIDIIDKKKDYGTDEIESKLYFNRYWVNKKSLLPWRRMMYSRKLENGREAIDIYDFSASIEASNPNSFDAATFLNAPVVKEKERFETIKNGIIAPPFTVNHINSGKPLTSNELRGKVVLLDFWYLSCMPCRTLMPKIQKLQEKFKDKDVAILGINVVETASKKITQFLNDKQIQYPQYFKTGQLLQDYKLYAFPTTMILGKDGKIKLVEVGEAEDTVTKLEQVIAKELEIPYIFNLK